MLNFVWPAYMHTHTSKGDLNSREATIEKYDVFVKMTLRFETHKKYQNWIWLNRNTDTTLKINWNTFFFSRFVHLISDSYVVTWRRGNTKRHSTSTWRTGSWWWQCRERFGAFIAAFKFEFVSLVFSANIVARLMKSRHTEVTFGVEIAKLRKLLPRQRSGTPSVRDELVETIRDRRPPPPPPPRKKIAAFTCWTLGLYKIHTS